MKKKVLVTGANGQLAQTIKELYLNNSEGYKFTFVSKLDLDISNKEQVEAFLGASEYHYCINCAAYTNVEQAEKTPDIAFRINAEALKNLAGICEKYKITLLHVSTDYVFDGEKNEPYTIKDHTNPINVYGESKLQGELNIKASLKKHFIIRTSWLYSKKYGKNFYKTILSKVGNATELRITDAQLGCPTNCESLAKYIYKIITSGTTQYGVYHFCDKHEMTWYDFAYAILEENNALHKVKLIKDRNYITFAKRPKYSVLKSTEIVGH